jgi:chromosome partitioning protein
LLDMDIDQRTLSDWRDAREAPTPALDRVSTDKLAVQLKRLARDGYTTVIIDTPGRDAPGIGAVMRAAHLSLIPIRLSLADMKSAQRLTLATMARLKAPFAFVLNACPAGRSARITDAMEALAELGEVAPSIVQRVEHVDAIGSGLGVTEMGGKAGEEVARLWAWIKQRTAHEKA